jgi:hypothetical protein
MITYNLETATKSLIFQYCFFQPKSFIFNSITDLDRVVESIYLCYFTMPMHNEILSTEIERLQWILSQIDEHKQ